MRKKKLAILAAILMRTITIPRRFLLKMLKTFHPKRFQIRLIIRLPTRRRTGEKLISKRAIIKAMEHQIVNIIMVLVSTTRSSIMVSKIKITMDSRLKIIGHLQKEKAPNFAWQQRKRRVCGVAELGALKVSERGLIVDLKGPKVHVLFLTFQTPFRTSQ